MWLSCLVLLPVVHTAPLCHMSPGKAALNYSERLFERSKTLRVNMVRIDCKSGNVECNGGDSTQPR